MNQSKEMVRLAVEALDEKKGEDIKIIDIQGVTVIADYFVLASASNSSQTQALIDNVEEKLFKAGFECRQKEGNLSSTWVLLDYGDVIVHVFSKEDVYKRQVSVLALNMANSVEQFTDDHFEGSVSEDGGQFSFLFPDSMSPESQLLMKSLILGLTNIRDEYGAEYINFRFREV